MNNKKTYLIVDRETFKELLTNRLIEGRSLYETQVDSASQFDNLEREYNSWNDYNLELLKQSFSVEDNDYLIAYKNLSASFLSFNSRLQRLNYYLYNDLKNLELLLNKIDLIPSELTLEQETKKLTKKTKIFIVHGHDEAMKQEVARFVESLGIEAVILSEQTNSGATIIEKLEKHSDVGFAIVLYSPCDEGKSIKDVEYKPRARQNVIFEHGFLIGKIGRENVVAIMKENIEHPNDISGVVYLSMNNWKLPLAKELRDCGYNIDLNRL